VTLKKTPSILKAGLALVAGAMIGAAGMSDISAYSQDGEVPDKVLLLPFGSNMLGDGRGPFVLRDEKHAQAVIAATQKHLGNRDFMFDYDHEAMKVADDQVVGKAVASGWTNEFAVDAKGIWAVNVKWTPAAEVHIAAREYRYVSPLFRADTKTGEVIRLVNASLVNRPAFDFEAIAANLSDENSQLENEDMDPKAIAAALGLAEDADQAAILAAIETQTATQTAVAAALNAKEDDDLAVVAAGFVATAAKAGAPDPKAFVPIAAFEQLQTTVGTLTKERNEGVIAAATREGKITPAEKAWAASFIEQYGETEFAAALANRPKIIGDRVVPKGEPGGASVDADELKIAASMGVSKDEFLAARKAEEEA
jgi:phage I-like protein